MGDPIGSPIRMNKDQYQIYALFGGSSDNHYSLSHFALKASPIDPEGTRNANIITTAIAGSFGSMTDFTTKTLKPILEWSARGTRACWQPIMNTCSERFLTGVNGDR